MVAMRATELQGHGHKTAQQPVSEARPLLPTVDWATVHLDPDKMSPRDREGFEFLTDWLADKIIQMEMEAQAK